VKQVYTYIEQVQKTLFQLPQAPIEKTIAVLHTARLTRRQVFIMGNGGSASTATHFACDLTKNTGQAGIPNFKAISLTDNVALIMALANDEGYEFVFSRQLEGLIQQGDIVIGISASGNSQNVLNAINLAKSQGATTVGFTGFDGGKLGQMVDIHVHVNNNCIEQVEDIHLMLEHMVTKILREKNQEVLAEMDLGVAQSASIYENYTLPAVPVSAQILGSTD
jgi:D-sedoheptulose 7-phosphate isomerase